MPGYVDGFVIPLKKSKVKQYLAQAKLGAQVWKDHGALGYFETIGEDLGSFPGTLGFKKLARLKAGETAVFSWIVYKSRAHRDRVNKAVMKDPRMQDPAMITMAPFDLKRMAMGGFEVLVAW